MLGLQGAGVTLYIFECADRGSDKPAYNLIAELRDRLFVLGEQTVGVSEGWLDELARVELKQGVHHLEEGKRSPRLTDVSLGLVLREQPDG